MKIEKFVKCELEKKREKKKIANMLPTNVSMFYELSETILPFCQCYLHLDVFEFLHRYLSFIFNFLSTFSKVKLPSVLKDRSSSSQSTSHTSGLSYRFLKVIYNDYSMVIQ